MRFLIVGMWKRLNLRCRRALDCQGMSLDRLAILPNAVNQEIKLREPEWTLAFECHGLIAADDRVMIIVGKIIANWNGCIVG